MDGLVSWPGLGVAAVLNTGSVQYANEPAGSVVPSGLKVRYELLIGIPCRSPYRPVSVVRRSSAVCAMSGVWLLDRKVPLPSRNWSRCGIICRSDGTFGLSRKKWTLSKLISMTCLTPGPRRQPPGAVAVAVAVAAGGDPAKASPGTLSPGTASPGTASAAAASPARSGVRRWPVVSLLVWRRPRVCCRMNPLLRPAARQAAPAESCRCRWGRLPNIRRHAGEAAANITRCARTVTAERPGPDGG